MKIKSAPIILFGISLILTSCLKDGESELRAVVNEMHDELIEYGKNMVRAANSKEVADEIVRHNRKLIEFADVLRKLGEKYPALNNENYRKKYQNDALIEEINKKVNPVLEKYSGESEVLEAYQKIIEEMQVEPTTSGG